MASYRASLCVMVGASSACSIYLIFNSYLLDFCLCFHKIYQPTMESGVEILYFCFIIKCMAAKCSIKIPTKSETSIVGAMKKNRRDVLVAINDSLMHGETSFDGVKNQIWNCLQ